MQDFAAIPGHRTGRLVVQDQPAALGEAGHLSKDGIEIMPYDFFTPQPIKGNDLQVQHVDVANSSGSRCKGVFLPCHIPRLAGFLLP